MVSLAFLCDLKQLNALINNLMRITIMNCFIWEIDVILCYDSAIDSMYVKPTSLFKDLKPPYIDK